MMDPKTGKQKESIFTIIKKEISGRQKEGRWAGKK